ncbi:MAG: Response regulator [Parcubacteria group bacterium GW2011_GWA2_47_8]|nr:MAG: Response regulator [Parcubacteria group bacterium GW2011_GWA2_47_8]OHB18459.1 MAG: hypothetical protein A2666_05240 [Parcubacteria group bacterium RIFCSPHIGHO2_01_FULL_47_10b]
MDIAASGSSRQHAILIVEDDDSLVKALREKFIGEGFQVYEARNGKEGLEQALSKHPDLILLDVVMARMDGLSMLQVLREDSWGKTAKVIMLTNLSDGDKIAESLQRGVLEYLVKSDWRIEDVVTRVRQRLNE